MNKNDPIEARRAAEHWLLQDAYDYTLALQGYGRNGVELVGPYPTRETATMIDMAKEKLLRSAERLTAALIVDARVMPAAEFDRHMAAPVSPVGDVEVTP